MDLNDYSSTQSLPWKPIALVAGGAVLVVIGIFIVVRLIQSSRQEEILVQNGGTDQLAACDTAADPETCREGLIEDLAIAQGSEELCAMLEATEDQDNCYWAVARETQDVKPCSSISVSEAASRCQDDVMEAEALALDDPALCEQIQDENRQTRCVEYLAGPLTSENCSQRHPELCEDIALVEKAKEMVDGSVCDGISDELLAMSCVDAVGDLTDVITEVADSDEDTDEDGLTAAQEEEYATDPLNPDTDGDGYLDGAEVAAGYDPNGPGRLQ
ncbi:hypothetical protein HY733_01265 [Candidatus Uhrbacteria bacterium]|nr:hypothetical protein [Candidatus Uhrbacteria bacterium]